MTYNGLLFLFLVLTITPPASADDWPPACPYPCLPPPTSAGNYPPPPPLPPSTPDYFLYPPPAGYYPTPTPYVSYPAPPPPNPILPWFPWYYRYPPPPSPASAPVRCSGALMALLVLVSSVLLLWK